MVKKYLLRVMVGCLLFVGAAQRTAGQTTGRIAGGVTDPSAAVIAGAEATDFAKCPPIRKMNGRGGGDRT